MFATLVLIRWATNIGYAITPLERLFYETALELAAGRADQVHFGYPSLASGHPKALPGNFPNVSVIDINDRSPENLQRIGEAVRRRNISLVITFDVQPEHPAFRVMRQNGVRTIVSYWGAPISSLMPAWKRLIKRLLLAVSRSKLDGLIFESHAMADFAIRGRGVPRTMIDIVPLGVDVDRFHPAKSDHVYTALDIPRSRRVVVFAGHCTPRKGIKTLIEAAIILLSQRRRSDILFLICGNTDEQSQPYQAMYEGLGVEQWIRFAGYRGDMVEIYQSAFCGVIPSSGWDSFPRSAVEMAATGLPVVASRLHGLAEAVLDNETGVLFEPGNARSLADALQQLLDSPERAAALGWAGRQRCERELNLSAQRQRFRDAIGRRLPSSLR